MYTVGALLFQSSQCLSAIILRRQKKNEERHLYRTNIKKKSCSDNDYVDDDAIVIITLDQNVIFHFLTYTLMD
jgi:hypothetical protein